jgi:predicted nuclease of predicted toxin-antitoxin system
MIRFQADADLNQGILLATIRRLPPLDFQSATQAGLAGLTDPQVLALSASQDRILVTHDMRTMPLHFASFIQQHQSPGIIVVPQSMRPAQAAEELLLIASATETAEWVNRIVFLPL